VSFVVAVAVAFVFDCGTAALWLIVLGFLLLFLRVLLILCVSKVLGFALDPYERRVLAKACHAHE
jgi:hypothetical protein